MTTTETLELEHLREAAAVLRVLALHWDGELEVFDMDDPAQFREVVSRFKAWLEAD